MMPNLGRYRDQLRRGVRIVERLLAHHAGREVFVDTVVPGAEDMKLVVYVPASH